MSFCLKKHFCLSPRHSVILSSKNICLPLSLCHYVFKKISVSLCHHVIMSSKKYMSPFVIMSLCLQKNICLPLSLCHYVFKKIYVSLCHYVIMSSKKYMSPFVIMSLCLQKISVSLSVPLLFCLKMPQLGTEAGPAVVVIVTFLSVLYQHFISCTTSSFTTFL